MHDAQSHIAYLVSQLKNNSITQEELKQLLQLAGEENEHHFVSVLKQAAEQQPAENIDPVTMEAMWHTIREKEMVAAKPAHRVRFLKTAWVRYAAAAVIILGLGTAYLWNIQNEKRETTSENPLPFAKQDAAPGGNRAVLTLSDGRTIVLDSANNGLLAQEGNSNIKKNDGAIIYSAGGPLSPAGGGVSPKADGGGPVATNTMTTPRGGQYQLTLSDGTKVWLNAESSITYPTSFAERERERRVRITGEAYFEVAKDKTKPFIVQTRTDRIEVLGTHFNVRTYEDEGPVRTSLLEGAVRIGAGEDPARTAQHPNTSTILKPGQAYVNGRVTTTDTEKDIAWKNGVFNFNEVRLQEAMRQLSRWYDVDVVYEGEIPEITFVGKIGRDLTLKQVLKGLGDMGVKFRIEGKKLIVIK